jgi:phosphohistidine phosphatase
MKTLLIMRHAKSNHAASQFSERERPLTTKGERRAAEMGAWLLERELLPQLILTSTAVRACHTAQLVAETSGYRGEIRALDELYMAEADETISLLQSLPEDLERVLVVGHNPGLESLIPLLTEQIVSLPAAGLADISLPIDHWGDLSMKTEAGLIELWRPKELLDQQIPFPER